MKSKVNKVATALSLMACTILSVNAAAAPVTSIDNGTFVTMPVVDYYGSSPQTLTPNITWTTDYPYSVYGYSLGYGLGVNGTWDGNSYVGLNHSNGTMTFDFASPVAGFGGFMNYAPDNGAAVQIAAYDVNGSLLDTFTLSISTPYESNTGEFHGFVEQTANISSFTMSGGYIVGRDFVVLESNDVPEPASVALFGLGLLGFAASRRKSTENKNA